MEGQLVLGRVVLGRLVLGRVTLYLYSTGETTQAPALQILPRLAHPDF